MPERERSLDSPKVEVIFSPDQDVPFTARRQGDKWQLSINKNHFATKGFTPDEITGAISLEQTRLTRQTEIDTTSEATGLHRWQDLYAQDKQGSTFKVALERLAALSALEKQDPEKGRMARKYLEKFANRAPSDSYTDQLFGSVLKKGLGKEPGAQTEVVQKVFANLQKEEELGGKSVSPLEALLSPDLSSGARAAWFEARFSPRYEFLKRQDELRQQKEAATKPKDEKQSSSEEAPPPTPPSSSDEYEQHRGREEKGKGQPTFVVNPGFTGYWEEDSFDKINESTGRLSKSDTQRIKTTLSEPFPPIIENSKRSINGYSGTNLFNLPLAPGFELTVKGHEAIKAKGMKVFVDPENHVFIQPSVNQPINIEIALATQSGSPGIISHETQTTLQMPPEIDEQINQIISQSANSLERVTQWQDFVHAYFRYPKDDHVASMYSQIDNSSSRLSAAVQGKLLDCYLAREFFIAGLKRLQLDNLEWRGVNGYFVAKREKDGSSQLHSGNAHAWVKLRAAGEKNWIIFDPTPPGDPVHQGEGTLDEFGEFSSELLSQDDVKEIEQQAQAKEQERQKKGQETQDHYLMQFAQQAGITPEEAKEILSTLTEVDKMKDRQGRNILARLKEQFDRIVDYYTEEKQEYTGLVEMSRGQELEDPVATILDLRAGNLDPTGFRRRKVVEEKQEYYGGLDLEIVADGSGSMNESLGSKAKYLVQRDMSYLLHRALHRFSQEVQGRRLRLTTPIQIRSSQYVFRGNKIEEVKPLSEEFKPLQMALLWKKSAENIGGGTPAHLGLQAVLDKIPPEEVKLLQEKKLLKVVALISDGGYDNRSRVDQLIKQLQEMNVIVAEFPITDTQSLEDLPQNVAEKVIESASILMPKKVKS